MLRLVCNIACLLYLLLIMSCSSQTTTPAPITTSTTTTTEEEPRDLYAVTRNDIYALLIVAIGCPLCIAILCYWQKNQTKNTKKIRQRTIDKRLGHAMHDKQMLMREQQLAMQKQQAQQRQHAMSVPAQHMQPRGQTAQFTPKPAQPLTETNALPSSTKRPAPQNAPQNHTRNFSNRKEKGTVQSKHFSAPASHSALSTNKNDDEVFNFKPPPPAGLPPDQNRQKAPSFMKVDSTKAQEKKDLRSALDLPVIENDVAQSPPTVKPNAQTFDPRTGVPQQPSVMVPLKSKESDSEEHNNVLKTRNVPITDDNDAPTDPDDGASSSGAPLASSHDQLLSPQQQMAAQPMPSLQSIFGRRVDNKDDSDSDDSLLKRQQTFAANPDMVGSPAVEENVLGGNEESLEVSLDIKDEN
eukprot:223868_1